MGREFGEYSNGAECCGRVAVLPGSGRADLLLSLGCSTENWLHLVADLWHGVLLLWWPPGHEVGGAACWLVRDWGSLPCNGVRICCANLACQRNYAPR